jgi:HSP20 family protein
MKTTTQQSAPQAAPRAEEEAFVTPEVNIFDTRDGYVLEAEMPGVNKENLEITLSGNEITLVGRRLAVTEPGSVLFRESQKLDFKRVFELDPAIDTSKISAHMDQGILTLTLPKSENVKPRRIAVN